jgi:hypothetical protein
LHEPIQPSHESTHRCVVLVLSLLVLFSWIYAISGAAVYMDSGRALVKDLLTSTDYVWKKGSCDDLFRGLPTARGNGPHAARARELCDLARDNGIPPLSLKAIIDERIGKNNPDNDVSSSEGRAASVLMECRTEFDLQLPSLKAHYEPYRKQVAYMWLFIPALLGMGVVYYYAKRNTPVLFAAAEGLLKRLLFGKNRLNDLWESFIHPKKKP